MSPNFLPIACDPKEIETWDLCQCVCLVKTHRLIYNMTYLGHHLTMTYLELRSNFDLGSYMVIHVSTRLDETNTMLTK